MASLGIQHLLAWSPLDFDPGTMVWTWVVFGVVVFILAKAAWNPLLDALEKREKQVADGLREAEAARAEAKRLAEDFDAKVKQSHIEAQRIAEEARNAAERMGQELEDAARARAEALISRARDEVALAQRQALEEVREHAVDLAIQAAGAVVSKNLDEDDNRKMAGNVIKMVKKEGTGS